MSKATGPYQRKYFLYACLLQAIKHEKWLLYWDVVKIAYSHLAFSVFNKVLRITVINIWNTPETTEQMIICAYERVKCLCMSERNDDSPLEV